MPKLIIACGGREYDNYKVVYNALIDEAPTLVIEGKAPGADTLVGEACYQLMIPYIEVPALWGPKGTPRIRKAGYKRNMLMMKILLKLADNHEKAVIAFPGDKGTNMMMKIAEQNDVPVRKYGW